LKTSQNVKSGSETEFPSSVLALSDVEESSWEMELFLGKTKKVKMEESKAELPMT
jgi:hypothetical protein